MKKAILSLAALIGLFANRTSPLAVELGEQFEPMDAQYFIGDVCPDQINFVDENVELQLVEAWEP